jgi:hypothetical protein
LSDILFRNDDVDSLGAEEVLGRRNEALHLFISLCGQRLTSTRPNGSRLTTLRQKPETSERRMEPMNAGEGVPDLFVLHVCPWCYYDPAVSAYHRQYHFATPKDVRRHIERSHLQHVVPATVSPHEVSQELLLPFDCPYALCGERFAVEEYLKNHMAECHKFFCSPGIANEFDLMHWEC